MSDEKEKDVCSDHIRLPIGYEVDGVRYRNVVIDELLGIDDHLIIGKKAGKNAAKSETMVLCRTIQEIEGIVPQKKNSESLLDRNIVQNMYGPDRDFILSRVYMLSGRTEAMMAGECPRCARIWEEEVKIADLPVIEWSEDSPACMDFELEFGVKDPKTGEQQLIGKVDFPTGRIQELIAEIGDAAEVIDSLLTALIKDFGTLGKVNKEQVKRMKQRDRVNIIDLIANGFPGLKMLQTVNCDCGREYETRADLSAFLGGQRRKAKL
jgi:hypothetical protein